MTCKTRCNVDDSTRQDIINKRLVDTEGAQWELILDYQNRSGHLIPLLTTCPDDKLIALPGHRFNLGRQAD